MSARSGIARNWNRLDGSDRLAGVDLARGLAVIGMLAAHLLWTAEEWVWTDTSTWTSIVDGRSSVLFATLAGVSIGIVTGGRQPLPRGSMGVARARIAIRGGILLVFGILLILTGVPVYVILPAYAILFLIALPFTGLSARTVLWTAVGVGIVMSFLQVVLNELPFWSTSFGNDIALAVGWNYPFTLWIAFVLAGLGSARAGLKRLSVQVRMLVVGAALAAIGYGLAQLPAPADGPYWASVWTAVPHSSGLWEVIGTGGFAIAAIGVCLLLCRVRVVELLTLPLRTTGAMPLTAYTVQLLVWALIAFVVFGDPADIVGFRELDLFWPFVLWTIIGCTAWALLIGRGPLEWLLDRATRTVGRPALRR